ncbi:A24 family peptidase [Hydrogenophaga laconesensis]|uniref:Prepilin peptidase CpaA n=1 Tax=Hydrogenophaga laconesensis TaxID=1805971 RepID=A0ABU1VHY6_9BURK|nr:prepilin peptidase [Hydrogenophaga laconesensis]MDR7097042.1 prepilin peptidase CpaA [Hydrogenophaga laconesensis]
MKLALLIWLLAAIVQDGRERRVRNGFVLTGAALALLAVALDLQPFGLRGPEVLLGGAVAFGGLLCFYAFGLMGAGDVKFAGALGLWVGMQPLLPIWVVASLLAGLHGLLWLVLQRWHVAPRLALALSGRPGDHGRRPRPIPLAAYLAVATIAFMASGLGT